MFPKIQDWVKCPTFHKQANHTTCNYLSVICWFLLLIFYERQSYKAFCTRTTIRILLLEVSNTYVNHQGLSPFQVPVFYCELWKICKNTYFYRIPLVTASAWTMLITLQNLLMTLYWKSMLLFPTSLAN